MSGASQYFPSHLRFVEDKMVDWSRVAERVSASRVQNQWTDFGPVSRLLEQYLEERLGIPDNRKVVATSSGSAALFGLSGVAASRLGRPVRWIGSAFAFLSTSIRPLAQSTRFVDCDETGFLDLTLVDQLEPDSWDGLIVTNVFGADPDLRRYVNYCRERGKLLIADNATCLPGFHRASADAPDEIISFHHTKPWGFGEGGCAILAREDASLFRSLINCGYQADAELRMFAANGKISDMSAAAILPRLESLDNWSPRYVEQWHRIAGLARRHGFDVLAPLLPGGIAGFVPLLASDEIALATRTASRLPLRRYYPPISGQPRAEDLYGRIVCVPCHPGFGLVSDAEVETELLQLLTSTAEGAPEIRWIV